MNWNTDNKKRAACIALTAQTIHGDMNGRLFSREQLAYKPEDRCGEDIGCDITSESLVPLVSVSVLNEMLQVMLILLYRLQDFIVVRVICRYHDKEPLFLVTHLVVDAFEKHSASDGTVHFCWVGASKSQDKLLKPEIRADIVHAILILQYVKCHGMNTGNDLICLYLVKWFL